MPSLPLFVLSFLKNQLVPASDSELVELPVVANENGFIAAHQLGRMDDSWLFFSLDFRFWLDLVGHGQVQKRQQAALAREIVLVRYSMSRE